MPPTPSLYSEPHTRYELVSKSLKIWALVSLNALAFLLFSSPDVASFDGRRFSALGFLLAGALSAIGVGLRGSGFWGLGEVVGDWFVWWGVIEGLWMGLNRRKWWAVSGPFILSRINEFGDVDPLISKKYIWDWTAGMHWIRVDMIVLKRVRAVFWNEVLFETTLKSKGCFLKQLNDLRFFFSQTT